MSEASSQDYGRCAKRRPEPGRHQLKVGAEAILDTLLDRTVLAGYTSVGYRIRRHGWSPDDLPRMDGKVVRVTGASAGLGFAAAQAFAGLGASVWLVVRTRARAEDARACILDHWPDAKVHISLCDLSQLRSVREFAQTFAAESPGLDVLVNNAGVLTQERELSADGIELTLATNVIGPFLLTELLIPMLVRDAPARIVNVSSGGMYTQRIRVDDLQSQHGSFDGPRAYARSNRYYVKNYEEESNFRCTIFLDGSASMRYGGKAPMNCLLVVPLMP